jgi:hypothetical protein
MASVLVAAIDAKLQIVTLLATAAAPVDRMVCGLRTQPPSITVMTNRCAASSAIPTRTTQPAISNSPSTKSFFPIFQDRLREWSYSPLPVTILKPKGIHDE